MDKTRCINSKSPKVIALANKLGYSPATTAIKIENWQNTNNKGLAEIPTMEDMGMKFISLSEDKELYKRFNLLNVEGKRKELTEVAAKKWAATNNGSPEYYFEVSKLNNKYFTIRIAKRLWDRRKSEVTEPKVTKSVQLPLFNKTDGDVLSNQVVTNILEKLKNRFKIDYQIVSDAEAQGLLSDTKEGYNNEPGFYYKNKVYIVDFGGGLDYDSAIHEYGHPFMRALNKYNPQLFSNILADILVTKEGQKIQEEVIKLEYPKSQEAEEIAVRALTMLAKEDYDTKTGNLFEKAMDKLIRFLTSMLKDVFGRKDLKLSTLSPETTLRELADIFNLKQGVVVLEEIDENQVQYIMKAVNILNSDKAKQVFTKGEKSGWDLNKILTELQIPKDQKQLILDNGKTNREEIITDLLANYSYAVEINTAKQIQTGYGSVTFNAEDNQYEPNFDEPDNITELNANYYSNLTVPGGTNYVENEIATPAITPSIKGHAQFATDKGIGWFRSDDKTTGDVGDSKSVIIEDLGDGRFSLYDTENGIDQGTFNSREEAENYLFGTTPKTRRILEVQSDLFQKGRNAKELVKNDKFFDKNKPDNTFLNPADYDSHEEFLEANSKFQDNNQRENNNSDNQFLQLLNKDSNWVTFFIKSIIQDSAKKGYEKVLFPTGNTASKVEGHTTLEEFKKQKENEVNKAKEKIKGYDEIINTPLTEMEDLFGKPELEKAKTQKEGALAYINTLEQELERVETEGFGALKPIYNFYENTVTNILNKTYGKENVKIITDEYGNTWNEISIKPVRDLSPVSFNKKPSTVAQKNASITLDTLQKKVNEKDGMLSVNGFDNIWKRIFTTVKTKYSSAKTEKQLDAEKVRNEADMIIQNIQSDIIKKAFPEYNPHIADYIQTPETKEMYELLSKQLEPIIEKAKQRNSIMKAEIFVGNSVSSKGDIVSILEISPEGNYYIYDLNTKYNNPSIKSKYKSLNEWTNQINQVKTILETGDNSLGLKASNVEGAYLLQLEIDYKTKGVNIKSKSTYNGTNQNAINKFLKNREIKAMNIIAPKFLRTKSEKINDFIDRLYLQIEALMQKTPNTDVAKAANNALIESKLKLVQELQIEANTKNLIDHIQTELEEISNIVRETNIAGLPDSSDLLAQLEVYSKMSNFIDNPTLEQRKEMLYVQGLAVQLKNDILEYERKLIQNAAEKTGITNFVSDIFAAVKDISWFRKSTMGISKIDNPLVATAFRLYTDAMGKARSSVQTLADKILQASNEYKKFTGTDDYNLIIEGNSLVGEYTPEFWKEFSKAKNTNNWEWLSENVTFNKERYLAKRENMLNFLDSQRNKNINTLKIANPSISEQELTKELVELEKNEMRKWDNANKNNLSIHFTPKSKHINPKWKQIKEGKYKGTPVEAFYDLYRSVLEGANELFPEHIKSNFIPSFNQEFIEKTANLGLAGAIKASWSGVLDDLTTTYDENLYGEIDSATGMPIDKLFIPGLNNKENKSMDLGVVLFKFMEGVYRYKELSEIEQTILAVQRQLRNGKTKVVDSLGRELPEGKVADKNITNNRTADAFDDWIKSSIYNQKRVDEGSFEITDKSAGGFLKLMGLIKEGDTKKISYARLADKLIRYTSLHNLAFNMYSPLVNLFGGASNMYMSGAGGLDYTSENLTKAFSYVMQGKTGISSENAEKAKLIYEYFAIEQSDINRDIANELSNRYLTKLTDKYNGMTLMRESENVMQRAGLIAMILSNKHSIKWDDFSVVNGKLVVETDNMTREIFRQKVMAVNAKNLGGVNPDDLTSAKRYIAGRMVMQHRNWLPALAIERFGQKQFDYVLEREIEGRYRTAVRLYKALFNKSLFEKLTPMEQANLKATRMEAMLLLGTALLVIALKGVDDDEKEKSWYKISNKISTRALGELGFFIDPTLQSQYQILLSPAASTGVLEDVGGLTKSIWKEAFGDEEEKKRAKPLKKSIKLFPLANKGYSFLEDLNVIEE